MASASPATDPGRRNAREEHGSLADAFAAVEKVSALVVATVDRDRNTLADYDVARALQLATVKVVGYTAAVHVLAPAWRPVPRCCCSAGSRMSPIRINSIHPTLISDSEAWADNPAALAAGQRASLSERLPTTSDIVDGCVTNACARPATRSLV